ncbi:hypothetical protein U3516DRAFT_771858 [Neocallimastix sp. 'constans']
MIPPYRCMFNCHTGTASTFATLHKQRNTNIEALYAILKGKQRTTIDGFLAILEELETVILSDKAYAMGFLMC